MVTRNLVGSSKSELLFPDLSTQLVDDFLLDIEQWRQDNEHSNN